MNWLEIIAVVFGFVAIWLGITSSKTLITDYYEIFFTLLRQCGGDK